MLKKRWVLSALSICAAGSLLASPAFADDGKGGGGSRSSSGDDHGGRAAVTTTTTANPARGEGNNRGRDNGAAVAPATVNVRPAEVENEAAREAAEHGAPPAPVATTVTTAVANDDHGDGDHGDNRGPGNANNLLNQLLRGAAVSTAPAAVDDDADDAAEVREAAEAPEVRPIRVVSLATLTAGLPAADATAITTAVNANTAALQTFLVGGTANANAIDAALTAAGVAPGSVLALIRENGDFVAVTA